MKWSPSFECRVRPDGEVEYRIGDLAHALEVENPRTRIHSGGRWPRRSGCTFGVVTDRHPTPVLASLSDVVLARRGDGETPAARAPDRRHLRLWAKAGSCGHPVGGR